MKSLIDLKNQAIVLRKQGLSYKEIMARLPVSKSSLSGWFRLLALTDEELDLLRARAMQNTGKGRERASFSNRQRRMLRELDGLKDAQLLFEKYKKDPEFILGIGLYWAEGSKRTSAFQFINSDAHMVKFMIFWIQKYLGFAKESISMRVYTHEDFKLEKYEDFWSIVTNIPLTQFRKTAYKPNSHGAHKKNLAYKGCVRIELEGGMKTLRLMLSLQEILADEIKVLYS